MDDKKKLEDLAEDINFALEEIRGTLSDCKSVSKERSHEYENNHFMLTQAIAHYLLLLEEYNGMDSDSFTISG